MYRADHIKVLKVLAGSLPKRPTFKTKDVVEQAFKRVDGGDRRVRNAYRKIRKEGHAEISDRGEYRLTASGASFCTKLAKDGWKIDEEKAPKAKRPAKAKAEKQAKAEKKAAPKKATAKKAAPKKEAAKKTTTKKAAAKKAAPKKTAAKAAKKPPKKQEKTAKPGSNGVEATPVPVENDASAGATLSF